MLKRVYWVSDKLPGVVTAGVGFRASEDAPYERSIERWERVGDGWAYKGTQSEERRMQLERHPFIQAKLEGAEDGR
ncbi:hypothetical protein [Paenibacillus sp.]|uniref:hypothetical protein n=1 Tax=Paenibacillus sp. TaxID=58172 RepID=UPI002D3D70B2|nr:hypothetical protein [Paenibacillus sp.]HZG58232.1 hypothetical protein [Paenibacillus sp.]